MPALHWAGRLWPIADDDLVGFGVVGGAIRIAYVGFIAHAVLQLFARLGTGEPRDDPPHACVSDVVHFVLAAGGLSVVVLLVDVAISLSSASGSVWQSTPRRAVGPLLSLHVVVVACEAAWLAGGLLTPERLFPACNGENVLHIAMRDLYAVSIAWLALIATSTPAWIAMLFALSRSASQSSLVLRDEWCGRLCALFCSCMVRDAPEDTFASIARVVGSLLSAHGADRAVVSDLLTGLLLVRDAQERASHEAHRLAQLQRAQAFGAEPASHRPARGPMRGARRGAVEPPWGAPPEHDATAVRVDPTAVRVGCDRPPAAARGERAPFSAVALRPLGLSAEPPNRSRQKFYMYAQARKLELSVMDEVDAVRDAAHFMRFALGAYGMPIAMWVGDAATVREGLCGSGCGGGARGCGCCCISRGRANAAGGARAPSASASARTPHEVAFVRIARIASSDVLASDWARRHRPAGACAYAVCVDRASRSVVIAVRGTLDARDALTDVCAETIAAEQLRAGVAPAIANGTDDAADDGAHFADASATESELAAASAAADLAAAAAASRCASDEMLRGEGRARRAEGAAAGATSPDPPALASEWMSHRGIIEATAELMDELARTHVLRTLRRELQGNAGLLRGFRLVVTGHSLGAGVASLLTLLLRANGFPAARCIAFSPPPLLPRRAADACRAAIMTVALEGDVVPRLSLASVHLLAAQIVAELERCDAPKWLVWQRAAVRGVHAALGLGAGRRATAPPLSAPLGCPMRASAQRGQHVLVDGAADEPAGPMAQTDAAAEAASGVVKLYLAGRVMLLESVGAKAHRYSMLPCLGHSAAEHEAKWVDADEFQELKVAHSVIDHLPDRMAYILDTLASATRAYADRHDDVELVDAEEGRAHDDEVAPPRAEPCARDAAKAAAGARVCA
ncbi:hypothetical protein KFE25_005865 [Diacronema lutheri]|uniref:sn-1-specific diacylglycerol lipase n=1 Tax=Diacronema lutheri TaxID=2081491 RepID=A0A8J5XWU0_DIALT|nr:hypothetical protein KFE25_005865 [Diacronema lutheri]